VSDRQDTDQFRLADLLPDGYVPIDFAVSIKALDEEGDVVIINGRSQGLAAWEALGMLTCATDDLRATMQRREGDDD
jgi:hypothetical protein